MLKLNKIWADFITLPKPRPRQPKQTEIYPMFVQLQNVLIISW